MGQKFLIPQTITVDLGTDTKYQIDKILWIKRLKEKKAPHLLLDIFQVAYENGCGL